MNVYLTLPHYRPVLLGTAETDTEAARALGLNVDLFIHPGGKKEWAICLGTGEDSSLLGDWKPIWANTEPALAG